MALFTALKPQSVAVLSVFPLFSAERQLSLFCFHQPGRARSHSSPTHLVPGRTRPPLEIDKIANTQSELRNKYNHHVCEDNNISSEYTQGGLPLGPMPT